MQDFENRIRSAFEEETPNSLENILSRIEGEEQISPAGVASHGAVAHQKKSRPSFSHIASLAAMFLIVFTVGILLGNFVGIVPEGQEDIASLYIDVNPSIELVVLESGFVKECIAANEDAEGVLSELQLNGVEVNTAINAIIGSMYMRGYINNDANSILVSTDTKSEKFSDLLENVVREVDDIMKKANLSCSIVAQAIDGDDKTAAMAGENNISVGKMTLVNKIVDEVEDYSESDVELLAGMSVKELNLIYSSSKDADENDEDEGDEDGRKDGMFEVIIGDAIDYIGKDDAVDAVLKSLELEKDDVSNLKVSVRHTSIDSDGIRMVFFVSFISGDFRYEYSVDCKNAEISLVSQTELPFPQEPSEEKHNNEQPQGFPKEPNVPEDAPWH